MLKLCGSSSEKAADFEEHEVCATLAFQVHEPKVRLISAAAFADRVVHHALTRVLEPIFERRFTHNSFACRKGMGTHRALTSAWQASCCFAYVLKCDVQKYFASIDHAILKDLLARVVKCPKTLELAARIIDGSNPQEEATLRVGPSRQPSGATGSQDHTAKVWDAGTGEVLHTFTS